MVLPAKPLRFREPWVEPRTVQLENWRDLRGSEQGEWLEASDTLEPSARLHVVQQIWGVVADGPEKPPEGTAQARFYAESLNTVSLADGRLLAAARSATREITWVLAPVKGLAARPEFRSKLSVEVEIRSGDENSCRVPAPEHRAFNHR